MRTSQFFRRRRRGVLTILATVSLVAGVMAALAPTASAAVVDPAASYVLVNRNSGKALDLHNLATNDGAPIVQYTRNDGAWQQWQFVDSGGGYYRLKSRHSGKVLEFTSTADAVDLVQNTDANRTSQQFRLVDSTGGYARLVNRASSKAADVW